MKNVIINLSVLLFLFSLDTVAQGLFTLETSQPSLSPDRLAFIDTLNNDSLIDDIALIAIEDFSTLQHQGVLKFTIPFESSTDTFTAITDYVEYQSSSDYLWTATIMTPLGNVGSINLIRNAYGILGNIQLPQTYYSIHPLGGNMGAISKQSVSSYNNTVCSAPSSSGNSAASECSPNEECNTTVDILVLWTQEALDWVNAVDPNPFIQQLYAGFGYATMNAAISNSDITGVTTRVQTAFFDFTPFYNPDRDIDTDVDKLVIEAGNIRDQYHADIVILLTNQRYVGLAPNFNPINGAVPTTGPLEDQAFAIVEIRHLLSPRFVFAHEVSHLFGAIHEYTVEVSCPGGLTFTGNSTTVWETIQGQGIPSFNIPPPVSTRIMHFSNPDINFDGQPTGCDNCSVGGSNNAAKIDKEACTVSAFRPDPFWSMAIKAPKNICMQEEGVFNANAVTVNLPAPVNPGKPSYTYLWQWSRDGISPQGILGNTEAITDVIPPCINCAYFFLHLKVTASDGEVINLTKKINLIWHACGGGFNRDIIPSIDVSDFDEDFKLYPTPAQDHINVYFKLNEERKTIIRIRDVTGRVIKIINKKILDSGHYKEHIRLNNLPHGLYFVELNVGNESKTMKFILN